MDPESSQMKRSTDKEDLEEVPIKSVRANCLAKARAKRQEIADRRHRLTMASVAARKARLKVPNENEDFEEEPVKKNREGGNKLAKANVKRQETLARRKKFSEADHTAQRRKRMEVDAEEPDSISDCSEISTSASSDFNPTSHLKEVINAVGKANQARLELLCKTHKFSTATENDVMATIMATMADTIEIFQDYVPGYVMGVANEAFTDLLNRSSSNITEVIRAVKPPMRKVQSKRSHQNSLQKPLPALRLTNSPGVLIDHSGPRQTPIQIPPGANVTVVVHVPNGAKGPTVGDVVKGKKNLPKDWKAQEIPNEASSTQTVPSEVPSTKKPRNSTKKSAAIDDEMGPSTSKKAKLDKPVKESYYMRKKREMQEKLAAVEVKEEPQPIIYETPKKITGLADFLEPQTTSMSQEEILSSFHSKILLDNHEKKNKLVEARSRVRKINATTFLDPTTKDDACFEKWCNASENSAKINEKFEKLTRGWEYSFRGQLLLPMMLRDPVLKAAMVLVAFPATFFDVRNPGHLPFDSALRRKCTNFVAEVCCNVFHDAPFVKNDLMDLLIELDKTCKSCYWIQMSIIEIRKAVRDMTELNNRTPCAIRMPDEERLAAAKGEKRSPINTVNHLQTTNGQILVKQLPQCSKARYVRFPEPFNKVNLVEWLKKSPNKARIDGIIKTIFTNWTFTFNDIPIINYADNPETRIALAIFLDFDRCLVEGLNLVATARKQIFLLIRTIMQKAMPPKKYTNLQLELLLRELDVVCKTDYFRTLKLVDVGLREKRYLRSKRAMAAREREIEEEYEEDGSEEKVSRPQRLILRPPKEPDFYEIPERTGQENEEDLAEDGDQIGEKDPQNGEEVPGEQVEAPNGALNNVFEDKMDDIPSGLKKIIDQYREVPKVMKEELPEE
ncbi:unnamed protein product [Bursaphelenchus xylophilus]|uniref:(pine wood nematode) hypothetical protein n=1 Tax=Bursaphelenchus xylophilus TaxID=6326 RepID=A0A7I8XN20_BURXY|nr:unnamed protein product [Bursaphelenchus xylophilus]CAG9125000.1 unnamed protein product [Bursaphelenchus xylophilus]